MAAADVSLRDSVTIAASTQRVWALVTDVRRHPQFAGPRSVTKSIDFDQPLAVGSTWIAHEQAMGRSFDARSEILTLREPVEFGWRSFPPAKSADRQGTVEWRYLLRDEGDRTVLEHTMDNYFPRKGAWALRLFYALVARRVSARAMAVSLANIKAAAES